MRAVGVVLAAGEGHRIGGPKALLPIDGTTFLDRCCRLFLDAGLPVIAVLGAEAERVQREAGVPEGVRVVVNDGWREGMLSSLLCGLDQALHLGAGAILVHPVDNPLAQQPTVDAVVAALRAGARIAVPSHDGRRGHPAGFSSAAWPALRAAPRQLGARAALLAHPTWIVHVPCAADCLGDVDTPSDLAALRRS